MIDYVTRGKDARDAGLGGITMNTRLHFYVAVFQFDLPFENGSIRAVTDSNKQTRTLSDSMLSLFCVLRR